MTSGYCFLTQKTCRKDRSEEGTRPPKECFRLTVLGPGLSHILRPPSPVGVAYTEIPPTARNGPSLPFLILQKDEQRGSLAEGPT